LPLIPSPGQKKVDNTAFSARVRGWVREELQDDSVSVVITEANCSEDSCSPLETIIAILEQNPRTLHIDKAMCDVIQSDVIEVLATEKS